LRQVALSWETKIPISDFTTQLDNDTSFSASKESQRKFDIEASLPQFLLRTGLDSKSRSLNRSSKG